MHGDLIVDLIIAMKEAGGDFTACSSLGASCGGGMHQRRGFGVDSPISSLCLYISLVWITDLFSFLEFLLQKRSSKGSSAMSIINKSNSDPGSINFEPAFLSLLDISFPDRL